MACSMCGPHAAPWTAACAAWSRSCTRYRASGLGDQLQELPALPMPAVRLQAPSNRCDSEALRG
jgi:hypothetical protein